MSVADKIRELWKSSGVEIPSFQSLFLRFKFEDTILASGTGFIVLSEVGPLLITARHNVTGRDNNTGAGLHSKGGVPDRLELFHNGLGPFTNISKTEMLLSKDGAPLWVEHPRLADKCDVVALVLSNLDNVYLIPYPVRTVFPDIAVKPSELVSVIGFPMSQTAGGMLAIWCSGYVASEPTQDYAGQPKFLVDCRTRQGQSGSPVIAYRPGSFNSSGGGVVIGEGPFVRPLGVYTGRIHPEADIGEVWKWSVVEDLVAASEMKAAKDVQDVMIEFGKDSSEFEAIVERYGLEDLSPSGSLVNAPRSADD